EGELHGTRGPVLGGDVAPFAVVAAREGDAVSLFLADLGGAGVVRSPLRTVDPTRSVASVSFAGTPAERLGAAGGGWALIDRLFDRAAVLVAFEQVGGGPAALDIAREDAPGRLALGPPHASVPARQ